MKCKITEKKENVLLKRTEVSGTLTFDAVTPSNADIKKELANQCKAKEENIVMRNIKSKFGEASGTFEAYVYDSQEALKRFTPTTKHMKEAVKKAAEAAKKAAEEAKATAEKPAEPAEAKPEEKSAEAKAEEKPAEKAEEKA